MSSTLHESPSLAAMELCLPRAVQGPVLLLDRAVVRREKGASLRTQKSKAVCFASTRSM